MSVYDVRGDFQIFQSNGFTVFLHLDQAFPQHESSEAESFKGSAQAAGLFSTDVSGATRNNEFHVVIMWNQGSVGEYHGTFNFMGRLSGVTFDQTHPQSQATWFANKDFRRF